MLFLSGLHYLLLFIVYQIFYEAIRSKDRGGQETAYYTHRFETVVIFYNPWESDQLVGTERPMERNCGRRRHAV